MSKFENFTSIILALVIIAVIAGGFRTMIHSGGAQAGIPNAQAKLAEILEEKCAAGNLNLKVCHCVVERRSRPINHTSTPSAPPLDPLMNPSPPRQLLHWNVLQSHVLPLRLIECACSINLSPRCRTTRAEMLDDAEEALAALIIIPSDITTVGHAAERELFPRGLSIYVHKNVI